MRTTVKKLSAGEWFSAMVLTAAFLAVIVPAAIEFTIQHSAAALDDVRD